MAHQAKTNIREATSNSTCLICLTPVPIPSEDGNEESTLSFPVKKLIAKQLHIIFILKTVLELPSSLLEKYLRRWGHPQNWFDLCDKCSEEMTSVKEVYIELQAVQIKFDEARWRIREKIQETCVAPDLKDVPETRDYQHHTRRIGKQKATWKQEIVKECRAIICEQGTKPPPLAISSSPFVGGDYMAHQLASSLFPDTVSAVNGELETFESQNGHSDCNSPPPEIVEEVPSSTSSWSYPPSQADKHSHPCPTCKTFRLEYTQMGYASRHLKKCVDSTLGRSDSPLLCLICNSWHCAKENVVGFLEHIQVCREGYGQAESIPVPLNMKIFTCNLCPLEDEVSEYLQFHEYLKHLRKVHMYSLKKARFPWLCPLCFGEFSSETGRDSHINFCTEEEEFLQPERMHTCSIFGCTSSYFWEEEVEIHKLLVHKKCGLTKRFYECGYCKSYFLSERTLHAHKLQNHGGDMAFLPLECSRLTRNEKNRKIRQGIQKRKKRIMVQFQARRKKLKEIQEEDADVHVDVEKINHCPLQIQIDSVTSYSTVNESIDQLEASLLEIETESVELQSLPLANT